MRLSKRQRDMTIRVSIEELHKDELVSLVECVFDEYGLHPRVFADVKLTDEDRRILIADEADEIAEQEGK